jgi:hypothetical protein
MQLFIFQSETDGDVAAFTPQSDGGNLPIELAPWKSLGGPAIAVVKDGSDIILEGIKQDGFFLARGEVRVNPHSVHQGNTSHAATLHDALLDGG